MCLRIQSRFVYAVARVSLAIAALCCWLPSAGAAGAMPNAAASSALASVTLNPVADASLDEVFGSANFGHDHTLEVQYLSARQVRRCLIRFNLGAALPSEAVIDSARLELWLEGSEGAGSINLVASNILQNWMEGTVTWNTRPNTGAPTASALFGTGNQYLGMDVTTIVQAWHNAPHYGLELRGPGSETMYSRVFESREHGERPPRLIVNYHVPGPTYTLSGRVYEGQVGDESAPLGGVNVQLYGSNDINQLGTSIASTTTDGAGWYGLNATGSYEYYSIREFDPSGYESVGATSVEGVVVNMHRIRFAAPLAGQTLTGNKFWDRRSGADTPTPTVTQPVPPTATATPTHTGTTVPTATGTQLPTHTRVTDTPTQTPTPTTTLPTNCPEQLQNGDFELGSLANWFHDGAVAMGSGRSSTHGTRLGGMDSAFGELGQGMALPAGAAPIRWGFWWLWESETEQPEDHLDLLIQYGQEQVDHLRTLRAVAPFGQWKFEELDLTPYAGQQAAITFHVHTDGEVPSVFLVDDVSVVACGGAAETPTQTGTTAPTQTGTTAPTQTGTTAPTATATTTEIPEHTATATSTAPLPAEHTPTPTRTSEAPREWVVNTTSDHDDGRCQPLGEGDCTLREAMRLANEMAGPDSIIYDIPTDDPGYNPDTQMWEIDTQSALPDIADDGTSIDGAGREGQGQQLNTLGAATCKPSSMAITLKAPVKTQSAYGKLENHLLYGPEDDAAVEIWGNAAHDNAVRCNFITRSKQGYAHWWEHGVVVAAGAYDNRVDQNTLGNHYYAVELSGPGNIVTDNWIGPRLTTGPNDYGVVVDAGAVNNTIGHPATSTDGNVIVGNKSHGVWIRNVGQHNVVKDNYIGIDQHGKALPNGGAGVYLEYGLGSTVGPNNTIAHNLGDGVVFATKNPPGSNRVTQNSIYANKGKGIAHIDITPPAITQAGTSLVKGTTNPACSNCRIELYSNPSHSPASPAQGKTYLGSTLTQTDGTWSWSGTASKRSWLTATQTDQGDTSRFSAPKEVTFSLSGSVKLADSPQVCVACKLKLYKYTGPWPPPGPLPSPALSSAALSSLLELPSGYEEVAQTTTDSDGTFALGDERSAEVATAYVLAMTDPQYRVLSADSASGGEALPDGSLGFHDAQADHYPDNVFTVEQVAPQQLVVNTTADHDDGLCAPLAQGDCTLREAIQAADDQGGPTSVVFDIPEEDPGYEAGQWVMRPALELPELTAKGLNVGLCAQPSVVVDGSAAASGTSGFKVVGSSITIAGLVIRNWSSHGVLLQGAQADWNQVSCCHIVDNGGDGVRLDTGAAHNTIGGAGGRNLISGNAGDGVRLHGTGTDFNHVTGNYIGTDNSGTSARANSGHGVHLLDGPMYNDVGGELSEHGNVIAGNGACGVMIAGSDTMINRVGANLIGVAVDGVSPLGNGHHGVGIYGGAVLNTVGSSVLLPNIIGANAWSGVAIVESNTNGVFGAIIGTDANATLDLGNGSYGVHVVGSKDTTISSNTIAHNGADGVRIDGQAATRNIITVNSITDHGGKGIELIDGGNTELAPPVISSVTMGSVSGTACASCVVEVFSDPNDEGQFVHSPPYAFADASGSWTWSGMVSSINVRATNEDSLGNTSEFSAPVIAPAVTLDRSFHGWVHLDHLGEVGPLRAAQVGLFGGDTRTGQGIHLATVQTGRDGSFTLGDRYVPGEDWGFYFLAITDTNYVVQEVTPGPDAQLASGSRIVYDHPTVGDHAENLFLVRRSEADPQPPDPNPIVPMCGPTPPPPPAPTPAPMVVDFYIERVEVTQAIQCLDQGSGYTKCKDNSLELTAGKQTAVRVFVGCKGCSGSTINVPVRLINAHCGKPSGGMPGGCSAWSGPSSLQDFGAPLGKNLAALRATKSGSANWILPTSSNQELFTVEARVNWASEAKYAETNTANNVLFLQLPMYKRSAYKIKWALVDMGTGVADPKIAGGASYWMSRIYPFAVQYSQCSNIKYSGVVGTPLLKYLDKVWATMNPKPDSLLGWTQGCAGKAWIPGHTAYTGQCGDVAQAAWLAAHEIGHNMDMGHPQEKWTDGTWKEPCWPYQQTSSILEVGFDVVAKSVVAANSKDIMDGGSGDWVAPYTWNKWLGTPYSSQWAWVGPGCAASSTGGKACEAPSDQGQQLDAPAPAILVSGQVNPGGSSELDPCLQLDSSGPFPASDPGAQSCIDLRDSHGMNLASHCFEPRVSTASDGTSQTDDGFAFLLPRAAGMAHVVLRWGSTDLATQSASSHAPQVSVTAPQAGAVLQGTAELGWTAGDLDGDDLHFAVLYSPDDGVSWLPVAMDLHQPGLEVDTTAWAGTTTGRVRVMASDGFHTTSADSAAFSVPAKAPRVGIVAPIDGAQLPPYEAIVLSGQAEDLEDGQLPAEALIWSSDRQGLLGYGPDLVLAPMSLDLGWHTLTLQAADSQHQIGEAVVRVMVGLWVYLPVVVKGAS